MKSPFSDYFFGVLVLAVLFIMFAIAMSSGCTVPPVEPLVQPEPGSMEHDEHEGGVMPGAETIIITADEFGFSPDSIHLEAGDVVNVTLVNAGALEHEADFEGLDLHLHALAGETASGVLTAGDAAGDFEFACNIPGHYSAGMWGEVVVGDGHNENH